MINSEVTTIIIHKVLKILGSSKLRGEILDAESRETMRALMKIEISTSFTPSLEQRLNKPKTRRMRTLGDLITKVKVTFMARKLIVNLSHIKIGVKKGENNQIKILEVEIQEIQIHGFKKMGVKKTRRHAKKIHKNTKISKKVKKSLKRSTSMLTFKITKNRKAQMPSKILISTNLNEDEKP
jgi:hypothetical protein